MTAEDTSMVISDLENKPNKTIFPLQNPQIRVLTPVGGSDVFEVFIQKQFTFFNLPKTSIQGKQHIAHISNLSWRQLKLIACIIIEIRRGAVGTN